MALAGGPNLRWRRRLTAVVGGLPWVCAGPAQALTLRQRDLGRPYWLSSGSGVSFDGTNRGAPEYRRRPDTRRGQGRLPRKGRRAERLDPDRWHDTMINAVSSLSRRQDTTQRLPRVYEIPLFWCGSSRTEPRQ